MTYPSILFYLVLFIWMIGLLAGSLGVGRLLLRSFGFQANLLLTECLLGIGIGLALLSYIIFAASALHLLSNIFLGGVSCFWILAGLLNLKKTRSTTVITLNSAIIRKPFSVFLLIFLLSYILLNLIVVLTPEVGWDGVAYHLALPKIYLQSGGFVFRPDIFHNLLPQFTEMLYLPGMLFPYGVAAKLVHFCLGLLAAGAVYAAARESGLRLSALLSAVIFYTQFLVHVESGTAFIDLSSAAYVGLALLAFQYVLKPGMPVRWMYLTLFMMGINAATKWHGLIMLALATFLILKKIWINNQQALEQKFKQSLSALVWGSLPVLPYLARAWIIGGNPFWPLAFNFFGGKQWSAEAAQRTLETIHNFAGVCSGWLGLLRLPYDLVLHGDKFGVGGAELRWPLLGGILLGIIWLIWLRQKRTPAETPRSEHWGVWGAAAGVIFLLFWFQSSPQIRFLLPLFPLAAWLAAKMLAMLWCVSGRAGKIMAIAVGILFLAVHPPIHRDTYYQIKTILGLVPAETYCARYLQHYPACVYLNQHVQSNEQVLLFGENRGFYLDVKYFWGDPIQQKVIDYHTLKTPERLWARLQELGISWVLFRTDLYDENYLKPEIVHMMKTVLKQTGEERFKSGPVQVYRLKDIM